MVAGFDVRRSAALTRLTACKCACGADAHIADGSLRKSDARERAATSGAGRWRPASEEPGCGAEPHVE